MSTPETTAPDALERVERLMTAVKQPGVRDRLIAAQVGGRATTDEQFVERLIGIGAALELANSKVE